MKIDLHMHTNVSDGTDTPEEIMERVRSAGIDLFSVTDHDAVKAGQIIKKIRKDDDPGFITGVEFSCRDEKGKYHILGYGFDPYDEYILKLVERGHSLRMKKVLARLGFLRDEFNVLFPEEEVNDLLALDNPGKPHIGNMMVRYGYAQTKEEAINKFINRQRFADEYLRPEEAIKGIIDGGGIPVLAHPFYGSGDELILDEEMEDRLKYLMAYGLKGVEVFYSGFTVKLRRDMLNMADKYHLYVTAGSDYHGGNKLIELGDTGLKDTMDIPLGMMHFFDDINEILYR